MQGLRIFRGVLILALNMRRAIAAPAASDESLDIAPDPVITPAPTPRMEERQTFSSIPVASIICPLSDTDPAGFGKSGATDFLDNWLVTNGTTDWLRNLDSNTTNGGNQPSSLNCQPLAGGTCAAPQIQCQFFTPPEYFFIRVAATNCHDFFTAIHETLQDVVIQDALSIDQLIQDFAPQKKDDNTALDILSDILKTIAPFFSLSDKVLKQKDFNPSPDAGKQADLIGFIGGLISEAAADITDSAASNSDDNSVSIANLSIKAEAQLSSFFNATNEKISETNSLIFGGSGNVDLTSIIKLVSSTVGDTPDSSLQPITQIFSTEAFLSTPDQSLLSAGVKAGFQAIKQSMVGTVLNAQNYFVFVNTQRTQNDCNGITGSRFINNQCFTIEQRDASNCKQPSSGIDSSIVLKFDDPNAEYDIDLPTFYQNVQSCNNGQDASSVHVSDDYPPCAFNMPFIMANGDACQAVGSNQNIPDNLQINEKMCNAARCLAPRVLAAEPNNSTALSSNSTSN